MRLQFSSISYDSIELWTLFMRSCVLSPLTSDNLLPSLSGPPTTTRTKECCCARCTCWKCFIQKSPKPWIQRIQRVSAGSHIGSDAVSAISVSGADRWIRGIGSMNNEGSHERIHHSEPPASHDPWHCGPLELTLGFVRVRIGHMLESVFVISGFGPEMELIGEFAGLI